MLLSNPENGSRRSPPPLHGLIARTVSLSDSTIAEDRRRGGDTAPSPPPPPSSSSTVRPPPPPTATR